MGRPRVDKMGECGLLDPAEPLEIRVLHDVEMQLGGDLDKSVYRIVDDFLLIGLVQVRRFNGFNLVIICRIPDF